MSTRASNVSLAAAAASQQAPEHRSAAPVRMYNNRLQRRSNPIHLCASPAMTHFSARRSLDDHAQQTARLVPIRLDLEVDSVKIRDTFSWNLNEKLLTPEHFAHILIEDMFDAPPGSTGSIVSQIAAAIRSQCDAWENTVHEGDDMATDGDEDHGLADEALRTIIKLDLQVGAIHLTDQFEWPVYSTPSNHRQPTPEAFARQLCADLGLGGEFVSIIAFSIREQLFYARLNFDVAPKLEELPDPPVRGEDADSWLPSLETLSDGEMERRMREQDRAARRMRRSQRTIIINDDDDYPRRRATRNKASNAMITFLERDVIGRHESLLGTMDGRIIVPPTGFSLPPTNYIVSPSKPESTIPPKAVPYRNYKPSKEEELVILKKLEESAGITDLPQSTSPPKNHRGFGASAQKFNSDGTLDVGEFRSKWRCSWCLLSGKFTPTLRKGPMGGKTLCNSCGIWYGKHGNLPPDRYHEHAND